MYRLYLGWTHGSFTNFEFSVRNHIATHGINKQKYLSDFHVYPGYGDYHCAHLQALFSPDETGEYTFSMIGDDFAMLFIGYNDQATSRKLVAQMPHGSIMTSRYFNDIRDGRQIRERNEMREKNPLSGGPYVYSFIHFFFFYLFIFFFTVQEERNGWKKIECTTWKFFLENGMEMIGCWFL